MQVSRRDVCTRLIYASTITATAGKVTHAISTHILLEEKPNHKRLHITSTGMCNTYPTVCWE